MFIDETWASTNMTRTHGRAPQGKRLRAGAPHGHWKTTTFVAGIRTCGLVAPFVLDGPINRDAFEVYLKKVLVPEPVQPQRAESARDDPRFRRSTALPPALQPRLQPHREGLLQKLKALLRKAAERTVEGLWTAIGRFLDAFTPTECANYFTACGYGPT